MPSGAPPFKGSETMTVIMKHVAEPCRRCRWELAAFQQLIDRLLAKEKGKRLGNGKGVAGSWSSRSSGPSSCPRPKSRKLGDLARTSDREDEADRHGREGRRSRPEPKPRARKKARRPFRRFVLNLLLVLALAAWIFFNYERIPGMLPRLWRALASWLSSLIAKL